MVVVLDIASAPTATLEEVDDMRRFHVRIDGGSDPARVVAAFQATGVGAFESMEKAEVKVDALRKLAAGKAGPGWDEGFAQMIAYAQTRGWFDPAAGTITSHCELGG